MKTPVLISVIAATVLVYGCAAQPTQTVAEPSVAPVVGGDDPSGPPTVFSGDRSLAEESANVTTQSSVPMSEFELTIKRMADNPLTLYRSELNAYSFYVGDLLEAELAPEKGLTLRKGTSLRNSLICQYNMEGGLNSVSADPEKIKDKQKACADLMFTFDQQLGE